MCRVIAVRPSAVRDELREAVGDGAVVAAYGLAAAFVVVGIASVAYRPRGHVGSVVDWLRISVYVLALAVGAPLRLQSGTDHGRLALVPLTITAVLVAVAFRRARGRRPRHAVGTALVAAALMGVLASVTGSRLSSYGRHLTLHFSVPAWPSALGMAVVVLLAGVAGVARSSQVHSSAAGGAGWGRAVRGGWAPDGEGWARAVRGCVAGLAVTGAVAAVTSVVVDLVKFRSTWGFVPGLLGDGAAWLGGFSLGGRLEADLSSPIPFLSGDLGAGLVSGGAWPAAYGLLVVPLLAAVVAGRFQRVEPAQARGPTSSARPRQRSRCGWSWSRPAGCGSPGDSARTCSPGSAGLEVVSTVFVAALWGAAGAALGLALAPRTERG